MIEALLIILIIVMVLVSVLLYLNLREAKKKKTEISSKPISLDGLSKTINADADIVKHLKEKEEEDKVSKEQKEVLELMTNNRQQVQYKKALAQTIKEIRSGAVSTGPVKKEGMSNG